jgi:hypothetical protein
MPISTTRNRLQLYDKPSVEPARPRTPALPVRMSSSSRTLEQHVECANPKSQKPDYQLGCRTQTLQICAIMALHPDG